MRELRHFLETEIQIMGEALKDIKNPWYDGVCVGRAKAAKLKSNHIRFCERLLDILNREEKMLTVEELREREWEPIWLVFLDLDGAPVGVHDIVTKVGTYSMETMRGENLGLENIGKTWTAYSGKPTDENAYAL